MRAGEGRKGGQSKTQVMQYAKQTKRKRDLRVPRVLVVAAPSLVDVEHARGPAEVEGGLSSATAADDGGAVWQGASVRHGAVEEVAELVRRGGADGDGGRQGRVGQVEADVAPAVLVRRGGEGVAGVVVEPGHAPSERLGSSKRRVGAAVFRRVARRERGCRREYRGRGGQGGHGHEDWEEGVHCGARYALAFRRAGGIGWILGGKKLKHCGFAAFLCCAESMTIEDGE